MRRIQALFLIFAFLVCSAPAASAAAPNGETALGLDESGTGRYQSKTVPIVQIVLDGDQLHSDVPAFTWRGRTMVPVRLIAEQMGAKVNWLADTNEVTIALEGTEVRLKLGSAQAQVNGKNETLYDGIPAMVAKYRGVERTVVPLRFVSEQLGARVGWKQASYTALVSTGQAVCQVTGIEADPQSGTIHIQTSDMPDHLLTELGDRIVIDLPGAELKGNTYGTVYVNNDYVSTVRYAQHGSELYAGHTSTVRVVVDLKQGITVQKNVELELLFDGLLLTMRPDEAFKPTKPIQPAQKIVVLDAGHGGSSTGAYYEGIREKDINLAVTKKVEAILRGYGYRVIMTRSDDREVGLYTRAYIANAANADVFVSIHSNAAENNPAFTGIYTYYYPGSKSGAKLAQTIQTPLCRLTGAIDRGIESENFAVLRETKMSAVLVELGFMTNQGELQNLTTPSYQDKLAAGIAEGIVVYLNEST